MSRSPLAYPLNRAAEMDAGGAADLQTDIMRFMAILSLCLVAIFALVQSIPLRPADPAESSPPVDPAMTTAATIEETIEQENIQDQKIQDQTVQGEPIEAPPRSLRTATPVAANRPDPAVTLTRPKWVPKFVPRQSNTASPAPESDLRTRNEVETPSAPVEEPVSVADSEAKGFTLRFESDAVLTRLVATNRIGVYAVGNGRAQRMSVSESRISFWDASTPNSYHEMETSTVPAAVIDALGRSGTTANEVSWGVTLPGRLKTRLDQLMIERSGGALIIGTSGDIRWEAL